MVIGKDVTLEIRIILIPGTSNITISRVTDDGIDVNFKKNFFLFFPVSRLEVRKFQDTMTGMLLFVVSHGRGKKG